MWQELFQKTFKEILEKIFQNNLLHGLVWQECCFLVSQPQASLSRPLYLLIVTYFISSTSKTVAHLHGRGQVLLTDCVSRRWTWAALPAPGGRSWWTCSWGRSPGTSCRYLFSSHDQMTLHHPLPLLLHLVVPFVASVEPPAAVSPLVCSHCCCTCLVEHLRRLVPEHLNAPGAPLGLRVARLVIRQ